MNLQERCDNYMKTFPDFPPVRIFNNRAEITDLWIMGNQYQTSGYYGAYPSGYLKRILSLFPDKKSILHVCSGKLEENNELEKFRTPEIVHHTLDIQTKATYNYDAEKLSDIITPEKYGLILFDPPYSIEDAEHYGTAMVSRQKIMKQCHKILPVGGHFVILDQVFPLFSKANWNWMLAISMIKSTNHRVRAVFGFEKKEEVKTGDGK